MVWGDIIDVILVFLEIVFDENKITAKTYITFLEENLKPLFKSQRAILKRTVVFMWDNLSSHFVKKTSHYLY